MKAEHRSTLRLVLAFVAGLVTIRLLEPYLAEWLGRRPPVVIRVPIAGFAAWVAHRLIGLIIGPDQNEDAPEGDPTGLDSSADGSTPA